MRHLLALVLVVAMSGTVAQVQPVDMDIAAPDGARLRATYYSPGTAGPGILLLHECDMDRRSWASLARAFVTQGIHVLTFDYRGYGESPRATGAGPVDGRAQSAGDIDAAFSALRARPGVDPSRLAAGGASCGVNHSVELARRNDGIRALVLIGGPSTSAGIQFLADHPGIALFGADTLEPQMKETYVGQIVAGSKHPANVIHEIRNGGHGVRLFDTDPTLVPAAASWLAQVLAKP
ncbi:MAG: alpha/beta fold hydrolase [Acidobacteriota bacterium]